MLVVTSQQSAERADAVGEELVLSAVGTIALILENGSNPGISLSILQAAGWVRGVAQAIA